MDRVCLYCETEIEYGPRTKKFCSEKCGKQYAAAGRISKAARKDRYDKYIDSITLTGKERDQRKKDNLKRWRERRRQNKEKTAVKEDKYRGRYKTKKAARSRLYGLVPEDRAIANYMWEITKYCQICYVSLDGTSRGTVGCIDHDHSTNRFRGVLCNKCNAGIGLLGDNIWGVLKAVDYLHKRALRL